MATILSNIFSKLAYSSQISISNVCAMYQFLLPLFSIETGKRSSSSDWNQKLIFFTTAYSPHKPLASEICLHVSMF